ncbi:MAG: response regulator [Thermoguttaceae bacterium]|jgi:response regulator RpfG family c-di-GMP phosphodiesterase|nr:response regulator [Thermoguttaceae bacterium]
MTERILCVDDDPNVLQAYQRALRKRFHIDPALGGEEAIEAVRNAGPYAVAVVDMRMPGLTGVEVLTQIEEIAPDTVRMMLTGNADQQTALEAVNRGHVFRFMTKPCPPDEFGRFLEAGIEQYRLIRAERDLMSRTLGGCIKVLTDVLAAVNPTAFGRASRVQRLVNAIAAELEVDDGWRMRIAAMLSQVGCVSVPEETLEKIFHGRDLSRVEAEQYAAHPALGREMLQNIPRLEPVAEIIGLQEHPYEGAFPDDPMRGEQIPLGSRVLKTALDFDALVHSGYTEEMAMAQLRHRAGQYDPRVLEVLEKVLCIEQTCVIRQVHASQLTDGMFLAEDVRTMQGTLLCAKGQEMTPSMRARLRNYVVNLGLSSPIKVFARTDASDRQASSMNGSGLETNREHV